MEIQKKCFTNFLEILCKFKCVAQMMLDQKLISHLDVHHIYILVYFNANRSIKTSEKINQEVHLGDHNFKNNENFQPNV
jgi:hypothetical protein